MYASFHVKYFSMVLHNNECCDTQHVHKPSTHTIMYVHDQSLIIMALQFVEVAEDGGIQSCKWEWDP